MSKARQIYIQDIEEEIENEIFIKKEIKFEIENILNFNNFLFVRQKFDKIKNFEEKLNNFNKFLLFIKINEEIASINSSFIKPFIISFMKMFQKTIENDGKNINYNTLQKYMDILDIISSFNGFLSKIILENEKKCIQDKMNQYLQLQIKNKKRKKNKKEKMRLMRRIENLKKETQEDLNEKNNNTIIDVIHID